MALLSKAEQSGAKPSQANLTHGKPKQEILQ